MRAGGYHMPAASVVRAKGQIQESVTRDQAEKLKAAEAALALSETWAPEHGLLKGIVLQTPVPSRAWATDMLQQPKACNTSATT